MYKWAVRWMIRRNLDALRQGDPGPLLAGYADDAVLANEWCVGLDDAVEGERHVRERHDLVDDWFERHEVDGQDRLVARGRSVPRGNTR